MNGQCVAEAVGQYAFLADNRDRDYSDIRAAVATDACLFFETHLRRHIGWSVTHFLARPEAPCHRQ